LGIVDTTSTLHDKRGANINLRRIVRVTP
jgi:hypothetical protein